MNAGIRQAIIYITYNALEIYAMRIERPILRLLLRT